ncbi:F-box/LRR-repeat protein 25-like protein [Tanacetum coccineum]
MFTTSFRYNLARLDSTQESIILSKRWQDLWLQVPNLIIDYKDYYEHSIIEFFLSIKNIFLRYGLAKLNKFRLHARYTNEGEVESCIRYAIDLNVRELDIDVCDNDMGTGISLPKYLFTCSSLVHLKLYQCFFDNLDVTCWKNLRSLSIGSCIFHEYLFQIILSGTPVLETLIIDSCCGFEFIDITNESVNNFVICGSSTEDIDTLQINAPHIQSLTIKGKFDLAAILLLNVSSVVQAKLDYRTTYNFYNMGMHKHHRIELLKGLILIPHIKELKVGKFCLEVLASSKAEGFICPSNLKVVEEIDSN